jgi:hypothetical protein
LVGPQLSLIARWRGVPACEFIIDDQSAFLLLSEKCQVCEGAEIKNFAAGNSHFPLAIIWDVIADIRAA